GLGPAVAPIPSLQFRHHAVGAGGQVSELLLGLLDPLVDPAVVVLRLAPEQPSPQTHRCFSLPGSGRCPMTLWATSAPTVVLSATPSADRSISSSFSTRSSARFRRVCQTSLSVITSTATTTTIAGPDRSASDAACSHSSI